MSLWYDLAKDQEQFKDIMEEYNQVKHDKLLVIKWPMKYEELGKKANIERLHHFNINLCDVQYSEAFKEHYWNNIYYEANLKVRFKV